jgi:ApbE superfamily uncharacterized protein (UPF0280 family)
MKQRAQIQMLADGRRMHLHDGPIDLIVEAFGPPREVEAAYRAASARFVTVLDELCGELSFLRRACSTGSAWPRGVVARRMTAAAMPYAVECFVTPMAAVAGAVAEEILAAMVSATDLARAYVNDGGDIALHLSEGEKFVVGMVERPDLPSLLGTTTLHSTDPVRGIATSGWRGRSFSLGIADAVTVLADRAAAADAAATVIANAVDLPGHPAIVRVPACELAPDNDLGSRPVTQAVGELRLQEVHQALAAGSRTAERLLRIGLIRSAALSLQGETHMVGALGESRMIATPVQERRLAHA